MAQSQSCRSACRVVFLAVSPLLCLAFLPSLASAGSIPPQKQIDFRGGQGGTFSYTIGVGDSATVDNAPELSVISHPNSYSLQIVGGTLDFTTGQCIATCGEGTVNGYAYSVPQFGQGGQLELRGSIPSLGITNPNTMLIEGGFVPFRGSTAVGMSLSANPSQQSGMTAMLQVETINPELLAYFNFNPNFTGGSGLLSDLLLKLAFVSPNWNGEIKSSDLLVDPALPEPPTLFLFGSAMLFLAYLVRRKIVGSHGISAA